MTTRRGFLKGVGIAFAAPAIVRAESLMKIYVPKREILLLPMKDLIAFGMDLDGDVLHTVNGPVAVYPDSSPLTEYIRTSHMEAALFRHRELIASGKAYEYYMNKGRIHSPH